MACIKTEKRQIAHFLLFLSGLGILTWQIWQTLKVFIEGQTTLATSHQSFDVLEPPAIILCPKKTWSRIFNQSSNMSERNWHSKPFVLLNEVKLTLLRVTYNNNESGEFHFSSSNLTQGENFDKQGKTFIVEELMNPFNGLCYVLTPDQTFKMNMEGYFHIQAIFSPKEKIRSFDVYLIHPEYRYGFLSRDLAQLGTRMEAESGNYIGFDIRKIIQRYQSAKRYCKNYKKEDSYIECKLKNQVGCYRKFGPERGCKCILENIFLMHFKFHPIKSWNVCKTNSERKKCSWTMANCNYHKMVTEECPLPCQKAIYKAQKHNGQQPTKTNEILFGIRYVTMDVEIEDEVWILETYNFVGTIGGSLSLFIGFSYTGLFGQILDYLFSRIH